MCCPAAGWNWVSRSGTAAAEEMRDHRYRPANPGAVGLRTPTSSNGQIWNNDEAEFHGEHVDFDRILSWPKPVQAAATAAAARRLGTEHLLLRWWPGPMGGCASRCEATGSPKRSGSCRALAAGSGRSPVTVVALTNDPSAAQLDQHAPKPGRLTDIACGTATPDHAAALRALDSHASFL